MQCPNSSYDSLLVIIFDASHCNMSPNFMLFRCICGVAGTIGLYQSRRLYNFRCTSTKFIAIHLE